MVGSFSTLTSVGELSTRSVSFCFCHFCGYCGAFILLISFPLCWGNSITLGVMVVELSHSLVLGISLNKVMMLLSSTILVILPVASLSLPSQFLTLLLLLSPPTHGGQLHLQV